jgi:murein L,D-transpeptidase YcbB/YkuD
MRALKRLRFLAAYCFQKGTALLQNRLHTRVLPSLLLAALLSLSGCRHPKGIVAPHPSNPEMEQQLQADAAGGRLAPLRWPDFRDYQDQVTRFYHQRQWNPAWVNGSKPSRQARALIELFETSADKGLNPQDYDAGQWQAWVHGLHHADRRQRADFDMAMTVAAMRYAHDLHQGRVNPSHFSYGVDTDSKSLNLSDFLEKQLVGASDVRASLHTIEPDSPQYEATLQALHHYQQLAQQATAQEPLPAPIGILRAGGHYSATAALETRLQLLGDVPTQSTSDSPGDTDRIYSQTLADGVKAFQETHDLPPSGRLTGKTVAALNVPLPERVLEIEDTLERMRWLPDVYQQPAILVNIPEFLVRVYTPEHQETFAIKAVVGEAKIGDHNTPLVAKEMKYLVFRPFWVVTPTIIKEELVPKVAADPGYLDSHNFQVITRKGKPVPNWTLDGLSHGRYMVREKPGPQNSLGLVKFIFPNKQNIYLHSTPAVYLFAHSRRDYSHGCVRLQEPEKLADWVLSDQTKWTTQAIHDAMNTGQDNKTVPLKHSLPVVITYETARVAADGKVHFFSDIYGYNQRLEETLQHGDPFPVRPLPKKDTSADTV